MEKKNTVLNRLLNYFIRGLVLVAPTYFTLLIIWSGVEFLDNILPIYIEVSSEKSMYLPGLGFLIIISGIVLLGFFFSTFIPQSFLKITERMLRRVPLISHIYYSIKDLLIAFVGDKKKFNQPVLITVDSQSDVKRLGFITQNDLSHLDIENYIAVYVPHSYAFSGQLFLVTVKNITPLNASSTEVMKLIVSGGVSIKDNKADILHADPAE
jgi:uncharacterized membrane protein